MIQKDLVGAYFSALEAIEAVKEYTFISHINLSLTSYQFESQRTISTFLEVTVSFKGQVSHDKVKVFLKDRWSDLETFNDCKNDLVKFLKNKRASFKQFYKLHQKIIQANYQIEC